MARVTNLNRFRKQKARAEKRARAEANAAKYGRSKAQKALEQARAEKSARLLDAHRREDRGEGRGEDRGGSKDRAEGPD